MSEEERLRRQREQWREEQEWRKEEEMWRDEQLECAAAALLQQRRIGTPRKGDLQQASNNMPTDGGAIAAAVRVPVASARSVATPEAHNAETAGLEAEAVEAMAAAVEAAAMEAAGMKAAGVEAAAASERRPPAAAEEAAAVERAAVEPAPCQRPAQRKLKASEAKAAHPNRAEAKAQAKEGRQARPAIG